MTWGEDGDWESEVRWNRARLRDRGFVPYDVARAWRRRFWWLLAVVTMLAWLLVEVARRV